jgi:hypothetical protein
MPRKRIPVTMAEKMDMAKLLIGDADFVIVPFANDYLATSRGEVISLTKRIPFFMKPITMGLYTGLQLKRNSGEIKKEYLHRIMLRSFIGEPESGLHGAHLDGNKSNNAISNLTWATAKENNSHKLLHGTDGNGERNGMAKLTQKLVDEMRDVRKDSNMPFHMIAGLFNVSTMTAFRAVTGRAWK